MDRSKSPCGAREYPTTCFIYMNLLLTVMFIFFRREPESDSPFLKWSNIQPKLGQHKSEVLVLLDCCYGSQAARDSQSRRRSPVPPNVELFAACGMGEKTTRPGILSFTSLLIAEFRAQLASQKFAIVAIAHKNMASKASSLQQSAVYFPLEKKNGTIRLEPFQELGACHIETTVEAASLTLQLSIGDSDRKAFEDVIEWLKLNPPRAVSKVVVEKVITSASAIYKYASEQGDGTRSMASFEKLSEPAKKDIWSAWNSLSASIAGLAMSVRKSRPLVAPSEPLNKDDVSGNFMHELDRSLRPFQSAVERNVMSLPELKGREALLKAIDDKMMEDLGFAEILNLRLVAHFGPPVELNSSLEVDLDTTELKSEGPFLNLSIEELSPLGSVLVEYKKYDEASTDKHVLVISKQRMQKLAELLSSSKSADFHTLTCLRFFHEPQLAQYGLIFGIPEGSRQYPISLRDVILRRFKPTLGQRFQIAHKIGKAISKWHLVDWVHQGIASHNIVFFYDKIHGVDYSKPYLCGFEYSRESGSPSTSRFVENFELNVYRHPDRQGIPTKSHRKEHDIYAYGILLLEIGSWKLVEKFFSYKDRTSISPYQMGQKILKTSKELLSHSMGSAYEEAANVCLSGDFDVEQDDLAQTRLAAAFETLVLEKIERGVVINEYCS
jgi:hypothetical protein